MGMATRLAAPLRVLIVDDADAAESIAEVLAWSGFEVLVVADSEGAFRAVEVDAPDVVVADLAVPDLDGLELARRVRDLPGSKRPLLVGVTAHPAEARRCQAVFDLVLLKPVAPAELVGVLRRFARVLT